MVSAVKVKFPSLCFVLAFWALPCYATCSSGCFWLTRYTIYCFLFQSDDCTVFFFTVGDTYKPIGFIETASPVVSIEWSKDRKVKNFKFIYFPNCHFCANFCMQGCARVPGCLRWLTFAFGWPHKLTFLILSFMLRAHDLIVWNLWLLVIFLRALPGHVTLKNNTLQAKCICRWYTTFWVKL